MISTADGGGGKLVECQFSVKADTGRPGRLDVAGGTPRAGLATPAADGTLPPVLPISCTQIEVHVFRRRGKRLEMLLIRRSPQRSLAGVWQPITGGIEPGESTMAAAIRELREETALTPLRWWALEQPATFYDPGRDMIRVVPVFTAEVAWTDPVYLSDEHDKYAFVPFREARKRVLWATQRRAIEAVRDEVLSGSAGGAAREITARVAGLAPRNPGRREAPAKRIARGQPPEKGRGRRRAATK